MKRILLILNVLLICSISINAQIGYQVSLLNSATGEPRANETVSVQVEITNSKGAVICSETKSATTNEFGVLSLQIGNANTFQNVDWSKLPLYVSATVDGIMVGKSQILNVPVAEAAKTMVNVSPDLICKTWTASPGNLNISLTLRKNFTYTYTEQFIDGPYTTEPVSVSGKYFLQGNLIMFCYTSNNNEGLGPMCLVYYEGGLYGEVANTITVFH